MHFRRIAFTMCLSAFALMLTACGSGKPEAVVTEFYKAAAKGDADKAVDLISFADVPANQMVMAKGKVQMLAGEIHAQIDANDGLKNVRIDDSTVQDDKAKVQSTLEFKNGKTRSESHQLRKEKDGWKIVIR